MSFTLLPIQQIAEKLGVEPEFLEPYGRHSAKIRLELLDKPSAKPKGKLILVTAVNPTAAGEGKTVTSIGLTLGLCKIGKRATLTSREPSLGPVFGVKGGACGGGLAQVLPAEKINLHFTGDFHAITSAHNLLAAMVDAHLHHGNELGLDLNNIGWPRAMDMNDRSLRRIRVGMGAKANGPERDTGFVITAASEIMAIMALAADRADLRKRLERIVVGYTAEGNPVTCKDIGAAGAMMVLLQDAILPNLVQTSEQTPAFVHCGPFGNIAHGTSSVISHKMALRLCDYVVNECGFGADLGAEKYFDIVMPTSGLQPSAAVIVASVRALYAQGEGNLDSGLANLGKHLENMAKFGVRRVVAINHFGDESQADLDRVADYVKEHKAISALSQVFEKGGEGARDLAEKVVSVAGESSPLSIHSMYKPEDSFEAKIETIAKEIYGAAGVTYEEKAAAKLKRFTELGYGKLPVCMAKTQYSLTDDPKRFGAPTGWTLKVTDASLSAGAGFVVAIVGGMMLMPGLGKTPQALKVDLDERGNVVGM